MKSENNTEGTAQERPPFGAHGLPERTLETYARLWQLETWLRELVYVHLRAKEGDAWEGTLQRAMGHKDSDKRLIHMPTPEESLLSYAQLSAVRDVIAENWTMFESYLPPKAIWDAKLAEAMLVRHRVAHFRSTHRDDLARVVQLLRDIDAGMWRFCTSYNDSNPVLPPEDDPVVAEFLHLDHFPWTEVKAKKWARLGHADPSDLLTVTVQVLRMPWAEWATPIAGREGFLYDLHIYARGRHNQDFARLLEYTKPLHRHVVHLRLDGGQKSFQVTIPAVLGKELVVRIITKFHDVVLNTLRPGVDMEADGKVQLLADSQPEYVLGPSHPMTFLTPEMPCSIFGV